MSDITRHRVFVDEELPYSHHRYEVFSDGSKNMLFGATGTYQHSHTDKMDDVRHENFLSRIKSGELIISPCLRSKYRMSFLGKGSWSEVDTSVSGHSTYYEGVNLCDYIRQQYASDTNLGALKRVNLIESDIIALAKINAIAAVDKPRHAFQEDLLSVPETYRSLRHPLEAYAEALNYLRAGKVAVSAAKAYAHYRFVISPLFQSVNTLYDTMTEEHKVLRNGVLLRATGRSYEKDHISDSCTTTNGYWDFSSNHFHQYEAKATCFYKLKLSSQGPRFDYGVRNKDLPEGFWNIVPLSFMVDRMISVNKMVRDVANLTDSNILWLGGCVVTKSRSAFQLNILQRHSPAPWSVTMKGDSVLFEDENIERTLWMPSIIDAINPVTHLNGLINSASSIGDLASLALLRLRKIGRDPKLTKIHKIGDLNVLN